MTWYWKEKKKNFHIEGIKCEATTYGKDSTHITNIKSKRIDDGVYPGSASTESVYFL